MTWKWNSRGCWNSALFWLPGGNRSISQETISQENHIFKSAHAHLIWCFNHTFIYACTLSIKTDQVLSFASHISMVSPPSYFQRILHHILRRHLIFGTFAGITWAFFPFSHMIPRQLLGVSSFSVLLGENIVWWIIHELFVTWISVQQQLVYLGVVEV